MQPLFVHSFRRALVVSSLVLAAALAAMAVMITVGLQRADDLLDKLSRSQDQLVLITRIQADIRRLRVEALSADPAAAQRAVVAVDGELNAYLASIESEARAPSRPDPAHQAQEARDGRALVDAFAAMRGPLLLGQRPAGVPRQRFDELMRQALARERREAAEAIAAMRGLRAGVTLLGAAVAIIVAGLGAAGAAMMLVNLLRPLRILEQAARRAGRGEEPRPLAVAGFAEFRRLAQVFDHMTHQLAAQRDHLRRLNQDLESQVVERTREIEARGRTLAEIDQVRRLFFSQIGHELRTPATVIRGEAEVALRDPRASAPRLREALEHVAANGAFLQRRLEDMLALAQADDGRIALRRERLDLKALVATAADLARPYARSSGASLATAFSEQPGPILDGDASWLQQALLALIDNAAKFAGETTIEIALILEPGAAVIRVTDGGPGVEAEDLPRLFTSHYQTAAGRRRGGSGLGLSVAQWVAQQHGGTIAAFSPPGEGLTVEIRLPTTP